MLKNPRNLLTYLLLSAALFLIAIAAGAEDEHRKEQKHMHDHAAPAAAAEAGNPLLEEMHILDNVFRDVVSAVSLGDGERAHHALHSMHGTMEKTHEGVRHGTVKLTKNADQLETFVTMDKEFHGELEKLAVAAKKNDQRTMLTVTKGLLDRCVKCHRMFR